MQGEEEEEEGKSTYVEGKVARDTQTIQRDCKTRVCSRADHCIVHG